VKVKSNHPSNYVVVVFSFLILIAGPIASVFALTDDECNTCHAESPASGKGSSKGPLIDHSHLKGSVHGGLDCVACHADIQSIPHPENLNPVDCSACHKLEGEKYGKSVHGAAFSHGDPDVPSCSKCHGDHNILAPGDSKSTVYPTNLVKVCISCHADEEIEARHDLPRQEVFRAYENSVHGRAIEEEGLAVAAACNDCHGTHEIKPLDDPESLGHKANIPAVCGQCHSGIYEEYSGSIHGKAVDSGIEDAPVCTDCHGEHTIAKVTDPQSKVYSKNIPTTCSACHDDVGIAAKYRLATRRYDTYIDSYHGVANKFGDAYVANCATCHGVHNIRPASDPLSTINKQNLPQTCGTCHPGASENFALGKIHVEATKESSLGVYAVRKFYTWFIAILVTCFVLYAVLETVGRMRRKNDSQGK
jgi:nitrate/TMAO reductase-like tetraheme cytochrome c subunit